MVAVLEAQIGGGAETTRSGWGGALVRFAKLVFRVG
jgi:hypothetical protein